MRINQTTRDYFAIGDREDLAYEDKLALYRRLVDDYFQVEAYEEFCARYLPHVDEVAHEWFTSSEFDDLLVQTVVTTFPAHEHEHFVAHYRGLLGAWASDAAQVRS
jgi:hypothetical protein